MNIPPTQYAKNKDVYIAYQVFGEGEIDLLFIPGFVYHLDLQWEEPSLANFNRELAKHFRVIMFDKRGTGLSDRHGKAPTFEERVEDIEAVMQAVQSKKAAFFANSEGVPMATFMAATYPERVSHLILFAGFANGGNVIYYPKVSTPEHFEKYMEQVVMRWGNSASLGQWSPDDADDAFLLDWWGRASRASSSPGMVKNLLQMMREIDVREILPLVQVPTLILHRVGDMMIKVENGRELAQGIPNSTWIELEGTSHLWWLGNAQLLLDHAIKFIKSNETPSDTTVQRVLSTIMFTDIVNSTQMATRLGDAAWRQLVERHDAIIKKEIKSHRGTWIKSTGDGCLAMFDNPSRALRCAGAIRAQLARLDLQIRVALHSGECEILADDITGIAVNLTARLLSHAEDSEVVCSETVKLLVIGSDFAFQPKGHYALKGIEGEWNIYSCLNL